jgi:O-antigen ligase
MAWRMHMWNQAWTLAKKFHFLGSGYGPKPVFTDVWGYPSIAYSKWISGPHNSFLTVLFRTGLLGLLSVFFVFFSALLICAKNLKNNERAPILFLAIIGIGFFASFNVCLENPQAGIWFWFFLGSIIPNLVNTPEREDPR